MPGVCPQTFQMHIFQKYKTGLHAPPRFVFIFILIFILIKILAAQSPVRDSLPPADTTASKYIHIRYADELTYEIMDADTVQKLIGYVEMNQDTVFIFCDSATIVNSTELAAKGNFILQQGDSTTIFADSADYRSDSKMAELFGNVAMIKGRQKLFTEHLIYDANSKIATYLTGATLTDDTTFLRSDRGYFHAKTDEIFFRDSVLVVNPDFTLRSDTLKYDARNNRVAFLAPTLITQDTAKIYTESGFYDIKNKLAEFDLNPQYVKNDQKAWADLMRWDGRAEEISLIGNAHFEDSSSVASAEVIRHSEKTGVTVLEGNGFFRDSTRAITGDTISFNSRDETYATRGRAEIVDGAKILWADKVDYLKEKETAIVVGNVIFVDTTEHTTVVCEYAEQKKENDFLKASGGIFGRPLLVRVVDGDSMFISADTLVTFSSPVFSSTVRQSGEGGGQGSVEVLNNPLINRPGGKKDSISNHIVFEKDTLNSEFISPEKKDSIPGDMFSQKDTLNSEFVSPEKTEPEKPKTILAYNDVKIYKSDLQAICDSLSYTSADSMFQLFTKPIIWSDTSQFTADHVRIQMGNDAIDKIYMEGNAFIVNTPDEIFFNQIKGRNSIAYFDSSELRNVMVTGNAESVYYALDDSRAYVGVNKTLCSEMKIIFGNNEVEGIVFYTQPTATIFPMKEADHRGELTMPGFSWQTEKRPSGEEDVLRGKKQIKKHMGRGGKIEIKKPDLSTPMIDELMKE